MPHPETWLKWHKHLLSLAVSVGQEFRSILAGWFWLKVTQEITVKMLARTTVIGRSDWSQAICFQHSSHTWMASWCSLLAGGGSVPHHMGLSVGVLGFSWHGSWLPQSEYLREQHGSLNVFYDLALEATLCRFCSVLLANRSGVFSVGGDYPRAWISGGHLGS